MGVMDSVKGSQEFKDYEKQVEILGFGSSKVISALCDHNFHGVHGAEGKLQEVKRGFGGKKVETVGVGRV